ncbi:conserved hypothetical protein [Leishmania mexicana MHOM/GT/2001/U1103]|uniref:Transmembrane protein n=1 Tax=Leishmania mexicana (strain MHOM/GT/2001/U1103) TaxID=929439 RepID=E9B0T3_LEIMU|nr:conserved hypothetical protein [Leishmania mexicana MHOM/GT/2001/U1103]CBZ28838.1 conserved hypothetical protein [Leishmania mexicana MHOM/GT/2001/U1103]
MFCRLTDHAAAVAVLAAVLCVSALAAPPAATEAPAPNSAARTTPPFEQFFAQSFQVSVMTQSSGVFNATLRMRASLNFPERVQGELIPIGEAKLSSQGQTLLPHFQRVRSVEDDKLSALSFSMAAGLGRTNGKKKGSTDEFAVAGKKQRPSLLTMDLHLRHSDAMQGTASVYYLPADLMALRAQRAAIKEGSAPPSATVEFEFRSEVDHMTGNPLSDVQALAHVSSAMVTMGDQRGASKSSSVAGEKAHDGSAAATRQGGIIFRWITEHEFSAHVTIPIADKAGATSTHMEQIWVYGYATPSKSVFDRKQHEVPLHNRYIMLGVGLLGFFVQVVSGITEGKKRAQAAVEWEGKAQRREKPKLEAPLLEQERNSKKKK